MRGIKFYEEFINKRKGESAGNCVAVFSDIEMRNPDGTFSGVGAIYDHPNSPVASTGVAHAVLEKIFKRVSERRAREVHPELFRYLDN